MKIEAKTDRFVKGSGIKAIASVSLDGMFVIKGLRVVNGNNGCFAAMPQESYTNRQGEKQYSGMFFPLNKQARQTLETAVLSAFDMEMYQNPPEWFVHQEEDMVMSM